MKKIIDQIDAKISAVLPDLKGEFTVPEFVAAFRKRHEGDWKRLEERFEIEAKGAAFRDWKKGPMPTPEKYLSNALKDFAKKNEKSVTKVANDRFKKASAPRGKTA